MEINFLDSNVEYRTQQQYFEEVSSLLFIAIEQSPSPKVAVMLARFIVELYKVLDL